MKLPTRIARQSRETRVANIVNRSVSGEKVAVPGLGSTDLDVVAPNGNLIAVGGRLKPTTLGNWGKSFAFIERLLSNVGSLHKHTLLTVLLSQLLISRLKHSALTTSRSFPEENDGQTGV